MSRTFGLVTAATLLASMTAFAQNPAPSPDTAAPPASSSDTAAPDNAAPPADKPAHHKRHQRTHGSSTDESADKLNACMSNATPTAEQEACLKQAAGTPS